MPIPVWDFRKDVANVVVEPEIRARFSRMEPGPAGNLHSHDVAGEIFVVLDGQCEFIVEDERVTCSPGQMIYVPPKLRHTLHAVGDAPCTVYLSVTPHVEPTHTRWNDELVEQPPRYGTWRGTAPDPVAGTETTELVRRYAAEARKLADLAATHAEMVEHQASTRTEDGTPESKQRMDQVWGTLRDVLWQVRTAEIAWNRLAPRATGRPSPSAGKAAK